MPIFCDLYTPGLGGVCLTNGYRLFAQDLNHQPFPFDFFYRREFFVEWTPSSRQ